MPQNWVARDPKMIPDDLLVRLLDALQEVESQALGTRNYSIRKDDVLVDVHNFGRFDRHKRDLQITILAHPDSARKENLDERNDKIVRALQPLMPHGTTGFIWIHIGTDSSLKVFAGK